MFDELCFKSYYDGTTGHFYVRSDDYEDDIRPEFLIEDRYKVLIQRDLETKEYYAYEERRIYDFAERKGMKSTDLHVNPFGDLCVAPKNTFYFKENSKDKDRFTQKLLIPFLYSHSFYEMYGKRPWLDYSHGEIGYLEAYIREKTPDSRSKTIDTLFSLKDYGIRVEVLESKEFLDGVQSQSEEAVRGARKLLKDIDRFSLRKFLK